MGTGAGQGGNHVALRPIYAVKGDGEIIIFNLQTAVSHPRKLIKNPRPRRPHAKIGPVGHTKTVARAKPLHRLHIGQQLLLRHRIDQFSNGRVNGRHHTAHRILHQVRRQIKRGIGKRGSRRNRCRDGWPLRASQQ